MNDTKIKVTGSLVPDFLNYLEDEILEENSPYVAVEIEEEKDYGSGKKAGAVEIIAITLSNIALGIVKDLFIDYLKNNVLKKKIHSATYKMKNDQGEELIINLNGLNLEDIEDMIRKFHGKVTQVEIIS